MKKLSFLLAVIMALTFTACGGGNNGGNTATTATKQEETTKTEAKTA